MKEKRQIECRGKSQLFIVENKKHVFSKRQSSLPRESVSNSHGSVTMDSLGGDLLQLALGISESGVELLGALDDHLPGLGRDALGDLTGVGTVVHEEQFNVFFVPDKELAEAGAEHVSGILGLLAADLGLSDLASEASADSGVNTTLLPPGPLHETKNMVNKNANDYDAS